MMVVFAKTLVFRHFRGRPCVKANKVIAYQGNACPVEYF